MLCVPQSHLDIQPAYDALLRIADKVLSIDGLVLERAKQVVLGYRRFSARHAVHLAVMQQHGVDRILSFDSGFDGFPGITRLAESHDMHVSAVLADSS